MESSPKPNPAEMYEQYFVPAIFAPWADLLLARAAPRPGERVLDVACGTGIVARKLLPLVGNTGKVEAADSNPAMLAVAQRMENAGQISWHQRTADNLPEGPFALICCQQGLQFFPDRKKALQEMHRVLKGPEGRVALSVWKSLEQHEVYAELFKAEADQLNLPLASIAKPFSMGSAEELQALLEEAGFREVTIYSEEKEVRFPEPNRFITLTILSAAAVIPEFASIHESERAHLLEQVSHQIAPTLQKYIRGQEIAFPMFAHLAVAHV